MFDQKESEKTKLDKNNSYSKNQNKFYAVLTNLQIYLIKIFKNFFSKSKNNLKTTNFSQKIKINFEEFLQEVNNRYHKKTEELKKNLMKKIEINSLNNKKTTIQKSNSKSAFFAHNNLYEVSSDLSKSKK